jgi:hypothetical protein
LYLSQEWQQTQQQRLFEVLDTVQFGLAKIRDDPSTHSYALDLDLGRQATMWEGWTVEEGIVLLPRLWQYTLLRCGLTSRADRYPVTAFRLLVLLGRRQEALGLAELLTDPARKVRVLLQIAEQIRQHANEESEWFDLLMRAVDVARTIQDNSQHARALSALSMTLAQAQQWTEAERVIATIHDRSQRAKALMKLGSEMDSTDEFEQLLHVTQRAWRQVETSEEALTLFSIASAFISRKPEVGIAFFDAFTWVDTFLDG